jgi:hypothetical protein
MRRDPLRAMAVDPPGRNHKNQANVAHGRLNHVNATKAEEASDVVLGMFLVNSVPTKV